MELIPGLPYDAAVECLIRVHFNHLSKATSVCKTWSSEILSHEFWKRRKSAGLTRPVLVMAQSQGNPAAGIYHLIVCDPVSGSWYELPPIPGFFHGLPMFCRIVGVQTNLVVMGGCDPITWKVLDSVFVYDFVSSTWRHGASMPGRQRFLFGCASDSDRTVIVAGGHDGDKNALRSAMIYDVIKNEWVMLPDMGRERDECKCIFHRGKFHVIGGYCTERQGGFVRDADVFDDQTRRWDLNDNFLETAMCPEHCASCSYDGILYTWHDGCLNKRNDAATWTKLTTGLSVNASNINISYMATSQPGKLLAIGNAKSNGRLDAYYVMNLSNESTAKIEVPQEHRRHVQSASCVEV